MDDDIQWAEPTGSKLSRFLQRASSLPCRTCSPSNWIKITAVLLTVTCVFETYWIVHLHDIQTRVPNDPYDNIFTSGGGRRALDIWDGNHQEFIHNAIPVPVHSHNDYWRQIPLFEALASGCISVEADVHLHDSDLLVGHNAISLRSSSTLRSLYLEPLQRMLESQNPNGTDDLWRGIFNRAPQQTVVLLVDLKTAGVATFAELSDELQPLRDLNYLTYWDGLKKVYRPLTVVATGYAEFTWITALNAAHRDIFWDARLDRLAAPEDTYLPDSTDYKYNNSNSHYASTRFSNGLFGTPGYGNAASRDAKMTQIEQAKARGLVARYWDTPSQPPNLREIVWRVLIQHGVGIMNMDDMGAVRDRARGWGKIY
ncbi:hypothetical protein AAFC00_004393 [Neodothiora populina]